MENASNRLARVRVAAGELAGLRSSVHRLLRPHLDGVIGFAAKWGPEFGDPSETYYATQYKLEEAAYLSEVQSALIYNRAACLGGMAVFFEGFRQAAADKRVTVKPSGIADLSEAIWAEFEDALRPTRT